MLKTTIEQDRNEIELPDGTRKYRIRTAVVEAGELPSAHVFVFQIQDPLETALDSFLRVASPYDLETYETDRALAVAASASYYLSGEFTRDFDNLETAVQAKAAILSRIDDLTRTWFTYTNDFQGIDDLSSHPSVSPEFEQQLKDAYSDAKTARIAAESDVASASADVVLAEAAVTAAQEIVAVRQSETEFCAQDREGFWAAFYGDSSTFETASTALFDAMITAYNKWATTSADPNMWPLDSSVDPDKVNRHNMWLAMDTFFNYEFTPYKSSKSLNGGSLNSDFNTYCQIASAAYAAAVSDRSTKNTAVATAVTAKVEADAELAAAQAAEAEALAAVLTVCPNFDLTSV